MAETGSEPGDEGERAMPRVVRTDSVLGGDPRVEGHRVGVYQVYQQYVETGDSPEAVAASYDLTVAEVHAALAYAFDNSEEMRSIEARDERIAESTASTRLTPDDA